MTAKTYLGKLNAEDLNSVLQQHGLNRGSVDSVSSGSGKSEFDEEYYKLKPPPLKINQKNIVTISAGANETVQSLALKCKNEGVNFNHNHNKQGFKNRQTANSNRRNNRNKRGKTNPDPINNFTNINRKQRPLNNTRQVQTRNEQFIVPNAKSPSVLTNTKINNSEPSTSTSKAPVYIIPIPRTYNFNTNSTINDEASTSKAPIPIPRTRSFKSLERKQVPVVSRETENIPTVFGGELQLPGNSAENVVAPPENKLPSQFPVRPIRGSFRSQKIEARQVVIKKEPVETIDRSINSNSIISNVSNSSTSTNINYRSITRQNSNMSSELIVCNNYRQESLMDKLLSFICCC